MFDKAEASRGQKLTETDLVFIHRLNLIRGKMKRRFHKYRYTGVNLMGTVLARNSAIILLTITDPKEQTYLTNVYASTQDPSDWNFDRVTRQILGMFRKRG